MYRFRAAPWPTRLTATSVAATAVLAAFGFAAFKAIPRATPVPFVEVFGAVVAAVPAATAAIAALFVVIGYEIGATELRVRRLLWSTRIELADITRAWHDPDAMKRSIRVFGNGGLYAVTGIYQNNSLGRYRAFVTDPNQSVVLRAGTRVLVLSPTEPRAFLQTLAVLFPGIKIAAPNGDGTEKQEEQ